MISPVCLRQAAGLVTSRLACLPLTRVGLELAYGGPWCPECPLNEPIEPVMNLLRGHGDGSPVCVHAWPGPAREGLTRGGS